MHKENTILSANGLSKRFGGLDAIINLNIEIKRGKITGLIGPNGAGKTTLFNLIGGVFPLDSGEIRLEGERIDGLKPYQISQMGIARTFQTLNTFPRFSVFENVRSGIIAKHLPKHEEDEKVTNILSKLGIIGLSQQDISQVTPVARRLVEVARAIIGKPKIVLFDEIMAGFNEEEVNHLITILTNYNRQHQMTFLIIGHTMRAMMDISDIIIVMNQGTKFAEGSPREIQKSDEVQRIYFGE